MNKTLIFISILLISSIYSYIEGIDVSYYQGDIDWDEVKNEKQFAIIRMGYGKSKKDKKFEDYYEGAKGVFNGERHPKVLAGEITREQAFDEFARNFNDRTGAGKIEKIEWNDYYAAVSASVENDEHFIILLKSTWQMTY